jgi:uncharacterized protein (DUF1501 family)
MFQSTNRRELFRRSLASAAGLAIGGALPGDWLHALANQASGTGERVLVVIQLSGGNDGLNTVVPYNNEDYRRARPELGIASNDVLKIDGDLGLHPSMTGVSRLLESSRFSIVQGVGYESPNRSHFESMDIWHTCQRKDGRTGDGWLGRFIASAKPSGQSDSVGLHLGQEQQPLAMSGRSVQVPSIASVEQFKWKVAEDGLLRSDKNEVSEPAAATPDPDGNGLLGFLQSSTDAALEASGRLDQALARTDLDGDFPSTQLGEKLAIVSKLILAGLSTKVYYVTLDGFDTHAQQPGAHAALLRQWSDALESFINRLEQAGQADRVLVMTFSEFGRRVQENASQGTDHGAAAPVFFSGPRFPKPVVGDHPNLTDLVDGDLKFQIDFRSVYATMLENWFGVASPAILGGEFQGIGLL